MRYARRVHTIAQESVDFVSATLFALVFIAFIIQVASRYLLRNPLGWSAEAIMIVFIWAFFWAAAFSVPLRSHISLDILYNTLPPQGRRWASIVQLSAIAVVFVLALPATLDYVYFMRKIPTSALEIPFVYVFAAFPVFMAVIVVRAAVRVTSLLLPGWRERLDGRRPPSESAEEEAA
jgi:TRAP-type C4-dicarboxylate transport system permease small subunit